MGFDVAADAYDRFMGRYSTPLAAEFVEFAAIEPGWRVLDVGCGPGALTTELVRRVGAEGVVGVDPSPSFVEAARRRHPGVEIHVGGAEHLPLPDDGFDASLAQLVVHFMSDPVAGLREMKRVTRAGGVVAACVWDFEEGGSPLSVLWDAARSIDPDAPGESGLPGTRRGQLETLFGEAGLDRVEHGALTVWRDHPTFEEWWHPYELGVGPAGAYVASLQPDQRLALADRCRSLLPEPPFRLRATAWVARGSVPTA